MDRISFWLYKLYILTYVLYRYIIGNSWKLVQGIYMPLQFSIGFNTLRWIVNGQYEMGEYTIVSQKISKQDVVMEIGTGLGFISSYCSTIVGSNNVHTYEANPLNIVKAREVFKKNNVSPNITNALLANDNGATNFSINKKSRLASSVSININNENIHLQKLNINEIISKIKPSFLIMDIEGGEYDIFKIINFQSIKKVQFELHPSILGEDKCEEIFTLLAKSKFEKVIDLEDGRNFYFEKK
ncbi:MAG: FkbM family methyltransferase [Ferruginibacter sp.]|nr:FkbM family methyltransferase [Ferruginibacter sp.]